MVNRKMARPVSLLGHNVLTRLSNGATHPVKTLADDFSCTLDQIHGSIEELRALGFAIQPSEKKGYRLRSRLELLDVHQINAVLEEKGVSSPSFEILPCVDSTNNVVARAPLEASGRTKFCFAEMQTGGRGRKGKSWVSPYASNLYFSAGRRFRGGAEKLLGLSLAVGVMVVDAVNSFDCPSLGLKWPNDLVWRGRKLGGILIELEGLDAGDTRATIGIGINLHARPGQMLGVDQSWVDLEEICPGGVSRNRLAGLLMAALESGLTEVDTKGWTAFKSRWESLDCCRGREVLVESHSDSLTGRAVGVDELGNLLVETDGGRRVCHSGDVSVRPL